MKHLCLLLLIAFFMVSCDGTRSGRSALFPVKSGGQYGYIDRSGNVRIPFVFSRAGRFDGGVALVATVGGDRRWGYIDDAGSFVINPIYPYATSFNDGVAFVVPEGGVPSVIDKNGVVKFTLPQAQGAENFSEGLAAYSILGTEGEIWGFVDKSGKTRIEPQYSAVSYFSGGRCAVMNSNGHWGYVNKKSRIAIGFLYDNAFPFAEDKAKVSRKGLWGVINKLGKYIIEPKYADLDLDGENYLVKKDGKWGWIDKDSKEIISTQFADAYPFNGNKYAAVKSGDRWGYINDKGKYMIAPQFTFAFGFDDGIALVEKAGKYGFIDEDGSYEIAPIYEHIALDYFIRFFARASAFYSVKTDINKPRNVAYKWLTGFYHMDYEEARKYATEDTRALLDQFSGMSDMISDSSMQRMNGLMVGIKDCKISGNRAIITYTLSDNRNKEQILFLLRTNDQWQVQFSKHDDAADEMEEGNI